MASNTSIDSTESDVFVEQINISNGPSPQRHNSPDNLNSTALSTTHTAGMPSVSSVAFPEPQIVTLNDDSNEPTITYGFGWQLPIIPLSLNDLNLPPNPLNFLATMVVVNQEHDGNYSPQSLDTSELSPILTPPMNVNTFDSWGHLTRRPMTTRFIPVTNLGDFIFSHEALHHRPHLRAR